MVHSDIVLNRQKSYDRLAIEQVGFNLTCPFNFQGASLMDLIFDELLFFPGHFPGQLLATQGN